MGDEDVDSLVGIFYEPRRIAENGGAGKGRGMHGKNGADLVIPVPLGTLVVATNENDVLDEFFRTGVYRPRSSADTLATSSPSMDISKASNFERFIFDLMGRDGDATRATSGYNAGAGQTVLWSGGSDRPAEALLAAISYAETRTHVRRVLANRRAYRLALPEAEAIGGRR